MDFSFFTNKSKNFIDQFFNDKENITLCENLKIYFCLKDSHKRNWLQIIDALPNTWKDIFLKDKENAKKLDIFDYHIDRAT